MKSCEEWNKCLLCVAMLRLYIKIQSMKPVFCLNYLLLTTVVLQQLRPATFCCIGNDTYQQPESIGDNLRQEFFLKNRS